MNERDTEIIYSMMMEEGYSHVSSVDEADLVIFNTCSVRKHAEDRVWGKMNEFKRLKKKIIGLVGCMGKAYGKEIFSRLPHVDFVSLLILAISWRTEISSDDNSSLFFLKSRN